ncbi:MAG: metallophosphoesterase [Lachnospiraceae bacterium]|nr:metallophosphoesterase [Lachnospiraceae bacterium]
MATKKILVVSDSHGLNHNLWRILEKEKPYDKLVHCGDYEYTESELIKRAGCEVFLVSGNNDYGLSLPAQAVMTFGTHRALIVHGHRHSLYAGLQNLYFAAQEAEADFCFFGHLHRPVEAHREGVTFLNPGSVTYPRQEGQKATYLTLTYETGKPDVSIRFHSI